MFNAVGMPKNTSVSSARIAELKKIDSVALTAMKINFERRIWVVLWRFVDVVNLIDTIKKMDIEG